RRAEGIDRSGRRSPLTVGFATYGHHWSSLRWYPNTGRDPPPSNGTEIGARAGRESAPVTRWIRRAALMRHLIMTFVPNRRGPCRRPRRGSHRHGEDRPTDIRGCHQVLLVSR